MLNFFRNLFKPKVPEKSRIDKIEERYLAVFEKAEAVEVPPSIGQEDFEQPEWTVIALDIADAKSEFFSELLSSGEIKEPEQVDEQIEKDPL